MKEAQKGGNKSITSITMDFAKHVCNFVCGRFDSEGQQRAHARKIGILFVGSV